MAGSSTRTRAPSLQSAAAKLGIPYLTVTLRRAPERDSWISPQDGNEVPVEEAVLASFRRDGWRGYSGEGGLVLNLIKAMSFDPISPRHRGTFIEALYAQNVAFEEDRFSPSTLLTSVAAATRRTVERNFDIMASREAVTTHYRGFTSNDTTLMLDFFPRLERWMLVELLEVAGVGLMHRIASKFMEAPYDYRRGWPDITMWSGGELRFVEVKAPGDKLQKSQRMIIAEFSKPLGLNFSIAEVVER